MTDSEIKEAIDNMSEQELNEYIFFALKEMTKKYETAQAEIEKKDKIIDLMATYIGKVDISEDLCNDDICDEGNNCNKCVKEYFLNEVEKEK